MNGDQAGQATQPSQPRRVDGGWFEKILGSYRRAFPPSQWYLESLAPSQYDA